MSDTLKPLAKRLGNVWEEADGELSEHHRDTVNGIMELADERNRLCHGKWKHADDGDTGTVRYFAKGRELAGGHDAERSRQSIAETRERTATLVKKVIEDTVARTGRPFPGMPGVRHDARC